MRVPFILLSLLLLAGCLSAQDVVFSQFYTAPLRLNPALTGIGIAPRVTANYRNQHTAFPAAYTTFAAAFDQPLEGTPSSIGLRMLTDRQLEGAYTNTEVAALYSYEVRVNERLYARLGLSGGFLSSRVDFSRLTFGDALDPLRGPDGTSSEALVSASKTSFDFGAGLLLFAGGLYGGLAVEHLNRPDESLLEIDNNLYTGRPQRFTIHGGAQIDLKRFSNRRRPASVTPNFLYSSQAGFRQLNLGAYFGYGVVALGGWYRHAFGNADAFILSADFRKDVFRFGVSYDLVVSELQLIPGGLGPTFELSVAVDFGNSEKLRRSRHQQRYNDCFGMFR